MEYTQMPSPVYQYVIKLFVGLPIRRGPGVFMNVSVQKHHALFDVAKFIILTPLSLLSYVLIFGVVVPVLCSITV
jgi:hypothetical protein